MPYVMVPVPEEYEDELMQEVLKMSLRASLSNWEPEPLRAFVRELEPDPRRLVDVLVEASMANRRHSEAEVASSLGISAEELRELVAKVNGRSTERSMPYLMLTAPRPGSDDEVDVLITRVAAAHLAPAPEPDRPGAS